MRKLLVSFLLLFLVLSFPVLAQDSGSADITAAAQSGDREAQYLLGLMYFDGDGIGQSYVEAEKWWLQSAQRGWKESQYSIGVFYSGHGEAPASFVNKNLAYAWLHMAALQGIGSAEGVMELVAADMNEQEIAEAKSLAAAYFEQYVLPYKKQLFTVELNGASYHESASVTPGFPIMAVFHHGNPAVAAVRMQHPGNPAQALVFEMDKPYHIQNHEDHMRAGHESSSEFVALDKNGREVNRITLSFIP